MTLLAPIIRICPGPIEDFARALPTTFQRQSGYPGRQGPEADSYHQQLFPSSTGSHRDPSNALWHTLKLIES